MNVEKSYACTTAEASSKLGTEIIPNFTCTVWAGYNWISLPLGSLNLLIQQTSGESIKAKFAPHIGFLLQVGMDMPMVQIDLSSSPGGPCVVKMSAELKLTAVDDFFAKLIDLVMRLNPLGWLGILPKVYFDNTVVYDPNNVPTGKTLYQQTQENIYQFIMDKMDGALGAFFPAQLSAPADAAQRHG